MSDEEVIKPKKRGGTLRSKKESSAEKITVDEKTNNDEPSQIIQKQKKTKDNILSTTKKAKTEALAPSTTTNSTEEAPVILIHNDPDTLEDVLNPVTFSSTGEQTTMNHQKELATRQQSIIDGPVPSGPKNNFLPHSEPKIKGTGIRPGPIAQTLYARVTSRFDFQQDLCKDYKETGTCSFGDTCKFLHDRGDYKTGWELEKEFQAEQKRKQDAIMLQMQKEENGNQSDEEDDAKDEKSGCPICEKPYRNPVKAKHCGHFFCESCVVGPMAKSLKGKCYVCSTPTGSSFKAATKQEEAQLLMSSD